MSIYPASSSSSSSFAFVKFHASQLPCAIAFPSSSASPVESLSSSSYFAPIMTRSRWYNTELAPLGVHQVGFTTLPAAHIPCQLTPIRPAASPRLIPSSQLLDGRLHSRVGSIVPLATLFIYETLVPRPRMHIAGRNVEQACTP